MTDDIFKIDYWEVAAALCRAVNEIGKSHDQRTEESVLTTLSIELEKTYPQFDWGNVLTDSWPLEKDES